MILTLKKYSSAAFDLLFPAFCISCKEILDKDEKTICRQCYNHMDTLSPQMLDTFTERMDNKHFDELIILFDFSEILQRLMHFLKYEGYTEIADYFANSLPNKITRPYDLICYVPLHKTKERERGYNQSKLIAGTLAELTNLELGYNVLEKTEYTKSQTRLSRGQRIKNIANSFCVKKDITGKSILLLDDVITTGATVNECAAILKSAGAKKVDVAAVATPADILMEGI